MFLPPAALRVNTAEAVNVRLFFYAWDNLTEFEKEQIQKCKQEVIQKKGDDKGLLNDRDILKFLQGRDWKMPDAVNSIIQNIEWLRLASGLNITPQIIDVL